jgi:DNA-binding NarL/FixJ family response regulator
MQEHHLIGIVKAAYNLSKTDQEMMRSIARAATGVVPRGPVVIEVLDGDTLPGAIRVWFERADYSYVARFAEWRCAASAAIRRLALSLGSCTVQFRAVLCEQLPAALRDLAHQLFSLCILASTGDGGSLHIAFGNPDLNEWRPTRLIGFHEIALHLAAAWRLRKALNAAALQQSELPAGAGVEASPATARDVLRRAVAAHGRARAARRSGGGELWTALVAGRWSLLDSFTTAGTRYIVAHENPHGGETLRALSPREQSALELALAGRSGKWIAFEKGLSEPVVTRTLRAALHKLGAADTAALSGVRNAQFEPFEDLNAGVDLAIARLPAASVHASLSNAERAVVDGLLGGKRIAAIARERGTSPRTVAHQISSTYQKLGVSSRRELLALRY